MATLKQPKITPFLWFDNNAADAAKFYCTLFKNSKILGNTPMVVTFVLDGQQFMALNGGPHFKFNESVSFLVNCKTQAEVDKFWEKLSKGGQKSRCGWLKDKYGLSWQIVPEALPKLMSSKDPTKAKRVMDAVMKMDKLIIKDLDKAYKGK